MLLQFLNGLLRVLHHLNGFESETIEHEGEYVPHARDIVDYENTY